MSAISQPRAHDVALPHRRRDLAGALGSPRTRAVLTDLALIAVVGIIGISGHVDVMNTEPRPAAWLELVSLLAAPFALALVPLRRRHPELFAGISIVLSSVALSACALSLVAAYTVGARLEPRRAMAWIAALVIPPSVNSFLWPTYGSGTYAGDLALGMAVTVGLGALGMYVGARRELQRTLQERAVADEQRRIDQAVQDERSRIAREMHDVLAHRMSLLSVHAGALEYRADAPQEDVARAAGVIRATAHEALEELRTVIGVLRVDELRDDAAAPEAPQPTLDDLPALVAEWRDAGARVDLDLALDAAVPETAGRTAYRVVQEALTNAGKHAPGARVAVTVGAAGDELRVAVANPLPAGTAEQPAIPGTGVGLVGMRERVELAGGALEAGPDPAGDRFRLSARLPLDDA